MIMLIKKNNLIFLLEIFRKYFYSKYFFEIFYSKYFENKKFTSKYFENIFVWNGDVFVEVRNTKALLIRAAIDLFSEKGYASVSIRELAKCVGIKSSSIYNHFASKEDIMLTIMKEYNNKFFRAYADYETLKVLLKGKEFDEVMDEIFIPFSKSTNDLMRKITRIFMIEQFNEKHANEFWTKYAITGGVTNIKNILDILIENEKIPKVNTLLAAEMMMRVAITYLIQYAHFQEGEETDSSLSMKTILSYIFDCIRNGKI